MNNEKYINYYVEILTNTLTDAIIRNVSLQANARVTDDVIGELKENFEISNNTINDLRDKLQNVTTTQTRDYENIIKGHVETIGKLNEQINQLNSVKNEYDSVKHQVQHVDTFRNQLLKSQKEMEDLKSSHEIEVKQLKDKIDYLQLTPAKRKKIDELNKVSDTINTILSRQDSDTKDGGSF